MSRPLPDAGHDPRFRRVGWRARIGLITPFAGLAATADFHRVAPEGVALALGHLARPLTHDTVAQLSEVGGQVAEAARRLARVKADVILWNTTSGSLIKGPGYDQELIRIMEEASGTPSTTASTASRICRSTSAPIATIRLRKLSSCSPRCWLTKPPATRRRGLPAA